MARIPIIRVEKPSTIGGYRWINEEDFDPKVHTLFDPVKAADAVLELEDRPSAYTHVIQRNGSWVVSLDGEPIKKGRGKAKLDEFLESVDTE